MTIYDLLPFLAAYQPGLVAAGFILAVAVGRTTQQWLYYSSDDARPLWPGFEKPRKHQADTVTDTSIVLMAVVGGAPIVAIATLSTGLWTLVQVGLHRGQGLDDFDEGEAGTWDLRIFRRTIHIPKFSGHEGKYAVAACVVLTGLVLLVDPFCLLTNICEL